MVSKAAPVSTDVATPIEVIPPTTDALLRGSLTDVTETLLSLLRVGRAARIVRITCKVLAEHVAIKLEGLDPSRFGGEIAEPFDTVETMHEGQRAAAK